MNLLFSFSPLLSPAALRRWVLLPFLKDISVYNFSVKSFRSFAAPRTVRLAVCGAVICALTALGGWFSLRFVPLPPALFTDQPAEAEFVDRNGLPLRVLRPEDKPYGHPLVYAEIPRALVEATLAAEDARFWQHPGLDWRATLRAAWQFVHHGRVISGGSTITQQLIKLAQPRPRTLRAKLIEAVQALRLEQIWDKQHILAAYLARLDYGNFNHGCAAADRFYFAKPVQDLSPAECAFLAALPQAPSRLNPHAHFARACRRQQWILSRMRERGCLTPEEYQCACAEPVQLVSPRRVFQAPHFIDLLLASHELDNPRSHEASPVPSEHTHPGLRTSVPGAKTASGRPLVTRLVRTTLDLNLNHVAEEILRRHLGLLAAQRVRDGAIVVLDNRASDVLALVGSENYFAPGAGQVNGAWAPRSAGSTFKPFTYLLAFEQGATPATVVADVPTEFATPTGLFAPANYNRHCYGPMRYRLALANSLNVSAVKVLASIGGPEPLQRLLRQAGLTTLNRAAAEYGLGLTIGNAEARLLELANAYATLARLGRYQPYHLLIDPRAARPLLRTSQAVFGTQNSPCDERRAQIADPSAAYLIADILSDNEARTLAFGAESPLRFDFPVACKTGTSSDFRDNWAFGYTPEFTVGVWVGNFDGAPMEHVSGVAGAAPILHDLFEHLHHRYGTSWYPAPTNIVECLVQPLTGKRLESAAPWSPRAGVTEKFLASNLPPFETPDDYALEPGGSVGGRPYPIRLSGEYADWYAGGDNWLGDRAVLAESGQALRILFPLPGTKVYLDPDLPGQGRRLPLRAAGSGKLHWQSDSLPVINDATQTTALLTLGRHELIARDAATGAQAWTWIQVVAR